MNLIAHRIVIWIGCMLLAGAGCSSMKPGRLSDVSPQNQDRQRAGNVFLLRGFIGIFSTGIDSLGEQIDQTGVEAQVFQDDQWRSLGHTLGKRYRGVADPEPLVLIGHSYGADDVVRVARILDEYDVKVDLLVTLDPVTPPAVSKNVARAYNLYQTNGAWDALPWLRGVPLQTENGFAGQLANLNIRGERRDLLEPNTDHFNIEKKGKIHKEVIAQVLDTCPPRAQWTATRHGRVGTNPQAARTTASPSHAAAPSQAKPVEPHFADVVTDQHSDINR